MYNVRARAPFRSFSLADSVAALEMKNISGLVTIQIVASCLDCDRTPAVDWISESGNPVFDVAAAAALADHCDVGPEASGDECAGSDGAQDGAARARIKHIVRTLLQRQADLTCARGSRPGLFRLPDQYSKTLLRA